MKNLNQFVKFDFDAFMNGKILQVIGLRDWTDYQSKTHQGKIVDTVIVKDDTPYRQKENTYSSNIYEKLSVKISKDVSVEIGSHVIPVNAVATVYGEYRNMLSVKADDIQIVTANARASAPMAEARAKSPIRKEI